MTTSPAPYRPDNFTERIIVTAASAFILLILAIIGFNIVDSWIPGVLILLLIPVQVVCAITDTYIMEDPGNAPSRAIAELKRLFPGKSGGLNGGHASGPGAYGGVATAGAVLDAPPTGAPPPANAPHSAAPQYGAPPGTTAAGGAPYNGPPPAGHVPPSGPVPLWPGHSYDPPGPHGPSVIHGFGSYGTRDVHTTVEPTPHRTEPAPPAAAPAAPLQPREREPLTPDSALFAAPSTADPWPPKESVPATEVMPASPTDAPTQQPQWDIPDGDDDFDDPDLTIPRPPRA